MKKGRNLFNISVISLFILAFTFSVITAFYSVTASFIELAVTTVLFGAFIIYSGLLKRDSYALLGDAAKRLSPEERKALEDSPLAVCITNTSGEIIWYNSHFSIEVLGGNNALGSFYKDIFKCEKDSSEAVYKDKSFAVLVSEFKNSKENFVLHYFLDNTSLKRDAVQFHLRKPSVVQILIDNYEELMDNANGSEKNFIVSRIESILEKTFVTEGKGILRKLEKDRFFAIIDSQHLEELTSEKFNILDKIHKSITIGHIMATVSMGIGKDAQTLKESDLMARQALDMALGRGGDQVAVKSDHGFEFFGGLSKGVEKRAKVRSRMIASALAELVSEYQDVIIMGHKMADFDCLGAAIGLCRAIRSVSKPVHICINREANLSKELIEYLSKNGYESSFISPKNAIEITNRQTLLIVVDTHNPDFVECNELLSLAGEKVVIDHHRKMVNFIDNAVIFYHEPNASSTCEMVTELIQYFSDNVNITKVESEALLSGIMLDTKNFIIKSGVRTFEAAAFLRKLGADLVKVNNWFANSIETYHQRAKLISASQIINGCAISKTDEFSPELLLAVPKTADELLHIKDVSASFVMYLKEGVVSISARSFGAINVQLIMEKLGGGGHLTMAGAQIPAQSCSEVEEKLLNAIEEYFSENTK